MITPVVHHHHAVGRLSRKPHLVRDDDHRHAFAAQLLHHLEHLADHLGIERARCLVEEHERRASSPAPGRSRPAAAGPRRACPGRRRACRRGPRARAAARRRRLSPLSGCAEHANGRLDDVLERGLVREEVEALEDHADLGSLPRNRSLRVLDELSVSLAIPDQAAVDLDPSGVDLLEVVDAAQKGRLSRAGRDRSRRPSRPLRTSSETPFSTSRRPKRLSNVGRADDQVRSGAASDGRSPTPRRPCVNRRTHASVAAPTSVSSSPRSLAASLRSICDWIRLQIVVRTRYQRRPPEVLDRLERRRVVDLGVENIS